MNMMIFTRQASTYAGNVTLNSIELSINLMPIVDGLLSTKRYLDLSIDYQIQMEYVQKFNVQIVKVT